MTSGPKIAVASAAFLAIAAVLCMGLLLATAAFGSTGGASGSFRAITKDVTDVNIPWIALVVPFLLLVADSPVPVFVAYCRRPSRSPNPALRC